MRASATPKSGLHGVLDLGRVLFQPSNRNIDVNIEETMKCPKCEHTQSLSEAMGSCPGCGGRRGTEWHSRMRKSALQAGDH